MKIVMAYRGGCGHRPVDPSKGHPFRFRSLRPTLVADIAMPDGSGNRMPPPSTQLRSQYPAGRTRRTAQDTKLAALAADALDVA